MKQLTTLQIYLKNGSYYTVQVTDIDTLDILQLTLKFIKSNRAQKVIELTSSKMKVEDLIEDLEIGELMIFLLIDF